MMRRVGMIACACLLAGSGLLAGGVTAGARQAPQIAPVGLKGIPNLTPAEKSRWSRLITEARQEGKLTVIVSSDQTNALYNTFGAEFGINVTIGSGSPTAIIARILAERQQGLHLEDVLDAGTSTGSTLLQAGTMQAFKPNIIIPQLLDRSTGWFLKTVPSTPGDPTKSFCTYATMTPGQNLTFFYNTNLVTAKDLAKINTWDDLINPKWRGLWEMGNVAQGVAANDRTLGWALLGQKYWEKFMSTLNPFVFPLGQDPLAVNALLRNQYAFAIFPGAGSPWHGAVSQGLPIAQFSKVLKPRAAAVPGASLCVFKNAPNQAAAQLFVNWILTPDGQAALNQYATVPGDVALRSTAPRGIVAAVTWQLARKTKGVFVAANHPNDVTGSLTWWTSEFQKLGIH